MRRSRTRDVAVCALQMWAYLAAYKSPHDDPDAQAQRVHVDYPIDADRVLGPRRAADACACSARSRARTRRRRANWRALDRVLVWAHWSWFMVPHGSLAYILVRHPERFPRAAVMTYAVFDIGASVYWLAADRAALVRGAAAGREDGGAGGRWRCGG